MVCDGGFYLDIISSFLLNIYELWSVNVLEIEKEERRIKAKRKILFIRLTVGCTSNIVGFILVCALNQENFLSGATAIGLFATILLDSFALVLTTALCLRILHKGTGPISDFDENDALMYGYRTYEIGFDVLILFYSLVLSDWEMTEFTTATTVLASLDILLNSSMAVKYAYDRYDIKDAKKTDCFSCFYIIEQANIEFRKVFRVNRATKSSQQ